MKDFCITMKFEEIIKTFNYNVEYIIQNQIDEDVLRRALQRENQHLVEDDEIFVQYPDWEGYYCSNYGRLISLKRKEVEFLKLVPMKNGYVGYTLYDAEKEKQKFPITANRMVADVFCPNFWKGVDRSLLHAHHQDRNKLNNKWTNIVLVPVVLHNGAMRILENKYGITDDFEICVSPSVDGELPVNK